jgi:uracil-DNA glycosylase
MQFALVDDNTEIPLSSAEAIDIPFIGKSGTPTCSTVSHESDTSNAENYFSNDFGVFIPSDEDNQTLVLEESSTSNVKSIVQMAAIAAVAIIAGLLLGGII